MNLSLELDEKLAFTLATIGENRKMLTEWEQGFFDDQVKRYDEWGARINMSPKQWSVLNRMYDKVTGVDNDNS